MATLVKRGLRLALSAHEQLSLVVSSRHLASSALSAPRTSSLLFTAARATFPPQRFISPSSYRLYAAADQEAVCPAAVNPAPPTPVAPDIKEVPVATYDDVYRAIHRRRTTILDVRTPFEVKTFGKIPNSVLIPQDKIEYALQLTGADFKLEFGFFKPDTYAEALITYCRSGARAKLAAIALRDKYGFRNVLCYQGSWIEWEKLHPEHVKQVMPLTPEEIFKMMAAAAVLSKW